LIYKFHDFSLDIDRRELRRAGELVSIEPQTFDLLQFLIQNRERVVSKDEIVTAVWNGRIVSESTITSRITDLRHAVGDTGGQQKVIRTLARKGFRFVAAVPAGDLEAGAPKENEKADPEMGEPQTAPVGLGAAEMLIYSEIILPEKPSIVVLPFANLSGDPTQEYFADGMVEDITIALGRLPWLFVIGSGSAFTYKNAVVDTRRVGTELGVRYVLRGSVRKAESRVRITAELADAAHGGHVWADRFDGEIDDVFDMQDRVASHVSAMIAPALQTAETKRTERKPTGNLNAYDLFLRAARYQRSNLNQNQEALRLLMRATELDPTYGAAYGLAAFCYFWQKVLGWVSPTDPILREGVRYAHLAVLHGENDSEALWMASQAAAMLGGEIEYAVEWVDQSTSLNPNSPSAWWTSCLVRTFLGDPEVALEHAARAQRLDPRDALASTHATAPGLAHFFAGRYEQAASVADQVLAKEPAFPPALRLRVAASGHLNEIENRYKYVQKLLRARPNETVTTIKEYYAAPLGQNPTGLEKYLEGLRLSGMPES